MKEFPTKATVFLSSLIQGSSLLKDQKDAAYARDRLDTLLNLSDGPQVLVLDLAGVTFTPLALQELVLPLAQRIRGSEHGTVCLVISTTDSGVRDFISYMAQAHQLPIYISHSPVDLREGAPVGALTRTERGTLDTINVLGGRVTASRLAEIEGIKPTAAANRLVNLNREGYLVRQPRGRREGDLYIEPRSATLNPMIIEGLYKVSETNTEHSQPVWSIVSVANQPRSAR